MKDPFPLPPIAWLSERIQPFADYFDLPTLPLHVHEVLAAALLYSVIFWPISPWISNLLAPEHYSKLSRKRRLNWDAHVVSMVQSCLINALAVWVMFADAEMSNMGWEERIWGYTGGAGFIQALAAGYFLWDLVVTSLNFDVFGIGTLAHAVAALLVYSLGFVRLLNCHGTLDTNTDSPAPLP
jgi:ABC-type Fe3+-siderophore transport system permease subunit